MTTQELEAIKARCEAATPGPWEFYEGGTYVMRLVEETNHLVTCVCDVLLDPEVRGKRPRGTSSANGAFIAHARTDVPALVAEVERLRTLFDAFERYGQTEKQHHKVREALAALRGEGAK